MTAVAPFNPVQSLEAQVPKDVREKLHNSAKQYEGIFLSQMMSIMFEDVDLNPMSEGDSTAEDQYKSMLTTEYGKAMAEQGSGIGLAQHIYRSLLETQIAAQEMHK